MITNIEDLPPRHVWLIRLVAQQMLLQFVELHADQAPVGNGPVKLGVLDRLLEPSLVGFEESLAALLAKKDALGGVAEVFGLQRTAVYQGEDDAIHDDRLEDLGHVKVEGVAALICGMQEADTRVEVGAVNFTQYRHIHEAVAERD